MSILYIRSASLHILEFSDQQDLHFSFLFAISVSSNPYTPLAMSTCLSRQVMLPAQAGDFTILPQVASANHHFLAKKISPACHQRFILLILSGCISIDPMAWMGRCNYRELFLLSNPNNRPFLFPRYPDISRTSLIYTDAYRGKCNRRVGKETSAALRIISPGKYEEYVNSGSFLDPRMFSRRQVP
ncbi:hypothetical protein BDV18DRAFT_31680 [Aspergillus unguis]